MTMPAPETEPASDWRRFGLAFGLAAALLMSASYGFIVALDPYGLRVGPGQSPVPIMDVNQRFMYPQIARSGQYDAAVFGTSTVRLLDPERLGRALGGRFANLAINAGTPWEQLQLAGLLVRHVPEIRTIVLGIDRPWCDPGADTSRTTFRAFPRWLYDDDPLNDWPELLNLKSLEIAGRLALNRLGLMRARIRPDGYEVFTPPEASYDLARVQAHLRSGPGDRAPADETPAAPGDGAEAAARRPPAVEWLADFVRTLPATTRLILLMPPLHQLGQPVPGSRGAVEDEACKQRIAAETAGRRAIVVDYRRPSDLTGQDDNFWDKLHYRLPVAARIVDDLKAVVDGAEPRPDAPYRVVSPGG